MLKFALLLLALLGLGESASQKIKVDPETNHFIHPDGRRVIYHGLNLVGKDARQTVTDAQIDRMVEYGFNVVRLGFLWSLYEVEPGVFDETYIDSVEDIVNRLGKVGIYSFLDMHQDLHAKQYCNSHGFPEWYSWPQNSTEFQRNGKWAFPHPVASPTYGPDDTYSEGYGIISNCDDAMGPPLGWATVYMTQALSNAVQRLYDNDDGILDLFGRFWQRGARRFKDNEWVLAYELVNEPWSGDVFGNPTLLVPGVADKKNLAGFYSHLHTAIREIDDETILFYEPSTGGNILDTFHAGFETGPGGEAYNDRQALSYHIYCPTIQADVPGQPGNEKIAEWVCEKANHWQLGIRRDDVKRLKTAGILSEFGAVDTSDPIHLKYLDAMMDGVDEQLHSWTYWYMTVAEDGSNNEAKTLARSYARVVAGVPLSQSFDSASAHFSLTFRAEDLGVKETEVFFHSAFYYPNGINWSVSPEGGATGVVDTTRGILTLTHTVAAGAEVTVTVSPK